MFTRNFLLNNKIVKYAWENPVSFGLPSVSHVLPFCTFYVYWQHSTIVLTKLYILIMLIGCFLQTEWRRYTWKCVENNLLSAVNFSRNCNIQHKHRKKINFPYCLLTCYAINLHQEKLKKRDSECKEVNNISIYFC